MPDTARLRDIRGRSSIRFVFDAARCCCRFQDRSIAQVADATAFSFQEQKNMATGDGGMLVLGPDAPEAWRRQATQLRNVRGRSSFEIRAGICRAQLPKLDRMNDKRRAFDDKLRRGLTQFGAIIPVKTFPDRRHVFHWFMATVDPDELDLSLPIFSQPVKGVEGAPSPRDVFASEMQKEGYDMPSHNMPVYLSDTFATHGYKPGLCPQSEALWRKRIVRLPLNLNMTDAEIDQVVTAVGRVVSRLT